MLSALAVTIFGLCFELLCLGIAAAIISAILGIYSTHSAYALSQKVQKNTALIQESDKALGIRRNKRSVKNNLQHCHPKLFRLPS